MLQRLEYFIIFAIAAVFAGHRGSPAFAANDPATASAPADLQFVKTGAIVHTEHFELIGDASSNLPEDLGRNLEGAYRDFYGSMAGAGFNLAAPDEPLTWICFSDHAKFLQYAGKADNFDATWLQEYYSPRTNRVAMFLPAAEAPVPVIAKPVALTAGALRMPRGDRGANDFPWLWHETAHQLSYSSGLLRSGVTYPIWLTEGLAINFEAGPNASSDAHRQEGRPRHARLMQALKEGKIMPLEKFIGMTHFRPNEGYDMRDVYAQSDGLFQFLLSSRPGLLKKYLSGLSRLEPGGRDSDALFAEFQRTFGSIDALNAEWHENLNVSAP